MLTAQEFCLVTLGMWNLVPVLPLICWVGDLRQMTFLSLDCFLNGKMMELD